MPFVVYVMAKCKKFNVNFVISPEKEVIRGGEPCDGYFEAPERGESGILVVCIDKEIDEPIFEGYSVNNVSSDIRTDSKLKEAATDSFDDNEMEDDMIGGSESSAGQNKIPISIEKKLIVIVNKINLDSLV